MLVKMKVLFTAHVEHYTLGLSRELIKHTDMCILSTQRFNIPCKHIILPNIPKLRGLYRKLALRISPTFFDIVHANNSLDGSSVSQTDKLIVTEHGYPDPKFAPEAPRYYTKERDALIRLYKAAVPIITISNYSASMLRKKLGVKVHKIIYHGLLNEFRNYKPKELAKTSVPVILWVSRFIPIKEPMVLLEAFRRLKELNFKVIMVGDGPLKENIKFFIKKHGLTPKIEIIKKVPFQKMPKLYRSVNILVHTATCESFGFSVLEGMGVGLPVIVPKSGGAYEIAGNAAVSFIPHDPKDLSEKIEFLLSDPDMYYRQSQKSLERSRFFTWQKAAKEYLAVYKKIACC